MPLRSSVWKSCWSSSGWSCDLRCPSISCWPHWPSPFPAEFLSEWLTLNCSKNQRSASAFRLGEGFNFFLASSFTCSLTIWRGQLGELQQVFNLLSKKSTRRGQNDEMQGNEKTRKPENPENQKTPRKPRKRENREMRPIVL